MKKVIVVAAFAAALWVMPSAAHADVQVSFAAGAGGNDSVAVQMLASQGGGAVHIPAGTMVSTGGEMNQDLVLGQAVNVELQEGERRTVTIPAYCMHSSRAVPSPGGSMQNIGDADAALQRLMAVSAAYSHQTMQAAVWAYRDGQAPSNELVAKIFLVAGVITKGG